MQVQNYHQYTAADHRTWSVLFTRQIERIRKHAYQNFEPGLDQLSFEKNAIPDFEVVNQKLATLTGWKIYAVPGLIDNHYFFQQMFSKHFGATTWIRKIEQLDYLEEPDMFHDVFGHVPLLTDAAICEFLLGLAQIAALPMPTTISNEIIEGLARLYWYTIEFGLVKENGHLKIYGAGILSSIGETDYCLSGEATRVPFDLETVLNTPYIKDKYQEQYFVLESMDQLREVFWQLKEKCTKKAAIMDGPKVFLC